MVWVSSARGYIYCFLIMDTLLGKLSSVFDGLFSGIAEEPSTALSSSSSSSSFCSVDSYGLMRNFEEKDNLELPDLATSVYNREMRVGLELDAAERGHASRKLLQMYSMRRKSFTEQDILTLDSFEGIPSSDELCACSMCLFLRDELKKFKDTKVKIDRVCAEKRQNAFDKHKRRIMERRTEWEKSRDSFQTQTKNEVPEVKEDEDPLMLECVECRNWVRAISQAGHIAIAYCCSNVLVSKTNSKMLNRKLDRKKTCTQLPLQKPKT